MTGGSSFPELEGIVHIILSYDYNREAKQGDLGPGLPGFGSGPCQLFPSYKPLDHLFQASILIGTTVC